MDRRNFLFTVGGAAMAGAVGARGVPSAAGGTEPSLSLKQRPLPSGAVTLTNGLLYERFMLNSKRMYAIPPDDILMPFFRAKGISGRGKELNGEYAAKVQTGIWPGLYSTMWMCGAAHIARWSGDPSQKQRLQQMVHDLADAKEPDGFLLAMGRTQSERWAHRDIYCLVRSMCRCLTDIYEVTGDPLALELARGQMECVWNDLLDHRPAGGGIMLRGMAQEVTSYYKLVPALALLYQHTGDQRYLELADMCMDLKLIRALAGLPTGVNLVHALAASRTSDPLEQLHASTWTDFIEGAYKIGLFTGNQTYVQAGLNACDLVHQKHMFITGSSSSQEHWCSGEDGYQLRETVRAQETCAAYSWMVFEQTLLQGTGNMFHAEGLEAIAYNDLFATQSPETGDFCYFLDLQGENKPYDPPPARAYHCCDGNGSTAIARLPEVIYGKTAEGIAINLYAASEATSDGIKIIQETDYPAGGTVLIRVEPSQPRSFTLSYRIPKWCISAPQVSLNGSRIEANGSIAREWKAGDKVRIEFPMQPTVVHDTRIGIERVAVRRGPVVYAATWSDDLPVRKSGEVAPQGASSTVDMWPYLPTLVASSTGGLEAEAIPPAVPSVTQASGSRIKVHYKPFHAVTRGKYSVWLPVVQV